MIFARIVMDSILCDSYTILILRRDYVSTKIIFIFFELLCPFLLCSDFIC